MHTSVLISSDLHRAIMLRSHHRRNAKRPNPTQQKKRSESTYTSKSYLDGLQRAFNRAKEQIYFNPDMQYFVTLTYAGIQDNYETVMYDLKQLCKKERRNGNTNFKYIYVLEWQKRGSLHVHMITNNALTTHTNKNGYQSLTYWKHGYTSKLTINDFDQNFKPQLYLFKYMKKAQRIGKSFLHSSRNLNNYTKLDGGHINLLQWRTVNMEYTHTQVETTNFHYFKNYLQFDDKLATSINYKDDKTLWLEQVRLHSMRELEKLVKNHTPH